MFWVGGSGSLCELVHCIDMLSDVCCVLCDVCVVLCPVSCVLCAVCVVRGVRCCRGIVRGVVRGVRFRVAVQAQVMSAEEALQVQA